MEGTESKFVARGCSVVVGVAGSRSLSMDAPLFVESDSVRNDGVDAHRARPTSLWLPVGLMGGAGAELSREHFFSGQFWYQRLSYGRY